MKTLWYGGSFNPVGINHLLVAQFAMEATGCDWTAFVPCYASNYGKKLLPYQHRREMLRLATDFPLTRFVVSDIEERIWVAKHDPDAKSYTYDTVKMIGDRDGFPVRWLIGDDTVPLLPTWHRWEELRQMVELVVFPREGREPTEGMIWLKREDVPVIHVSATLIRDRIAKGLPIRNLVTHEVECYIQDKRLYRGD